MLREYCNQEERDAHATLDSVKMGHYVPKHQVNRALFVLGDGIGHLKKEDMQPYQQRVVTEKAELDTKIQALTKFTQLSTFEELEHGEQRRMLRQLVAMGDYSRILGERIAAFGGANG
jgi:hypothetical protein